MKRFLLIALIIAGGLLWVQSARLRSEKRERRRLESNQTALMSDVEIYRTKAGKAAASNMVLNLRVSELERLRRQMPRASATSASSSAGRIHGQDRDGDRRRAAGEAPGTQPSSGRPRPGRSLSTRCGHFAGAFRG